MQSAIVIGGGLAGLSVAAALGGAGFRVTLFESRPFLGGRATSFPSSTPDGNGEMIDNCQHVLLRSNVNLLDFYRRLGVSEYIRFCGEYTFIEPGGRQSTLRRGRLRAPAHLLGSFLGLHFLSVSEKLAVARGLAAVRRDYRSRKDLDRISMADWLAERKQPPRAIERFWRPALVSAINEEPGRMAALHGLHFLFATLMAGENLHDMGMAAVPLRQLYDAAEWADIGDVSMRMRYGAERIEIQDGRAQGVLAGGMLHKADAYVSAVPFERVEGIAPELGISPKLFDHSPITGIHIWFDRPVMDLPHASLMDRTIQWVFNKRDGQYLQLVVSASRELVELSRADVVAIAIAELREFFPQAAEASVERVQIIKEVRATFSAAPGTEALRPPSVTSIPNVFLAGDWTDTGWPATMEGAVRSGYAAAEAVTAAAGRRAKFLLPDIA
ncbi:MAG TPA: hydroxysqualene dehydroxylase HpnE [Bryobacteraceae bacterium]|nr:hydroxysqualene dehydroxylase HpnE [Bryobacteraceae bacterium]